MLDTIRHRLRMLPKGGLSALEREIEITRETLRKIRDGGKPSAATLRVLINWVKPRNETMEFQDHAQADQPIDSGGIAYLRGQLTRNHRRAEKLQAEPLRRALSDLMERLDNAEDAINAVQREYRAILPKLAECDRDEEDTQAKKKQYIAEGIKAREEQEPFT